MRTGAAVSLVPSTRPTGRDVILTPRGVAEWLKVSERQVARLGIPSVRCGARKCRRYTERAVQQWIDAQVAQ